jgi:hypothetical protein
MQRTQFIMLAVVWLAQLTTYAQSGSPSQPGTEPTTAPAAAIGPASVMHAILGAIDHDDRKQALSFVESNGQLETAVAESEIDMMLAVSKLKKAIRTKIGPISPMALQMAVVGEDECGSMDEKIDGDAATIVVKSNDDPTWSSSYQMVRVAGEWKLSLADNMKSLPQNAPVEQALAGAKAMIDAINNTADAVNKGELKSVDDVNQRISQSMAKAMGG